MPADPQPRRSRGMPADHGFSAVEVIIAVTLLALMSIAMVPLILTAIQASVQNRSQVAATSYADAELASLRHSFPNDATNSCIAVASREHGKQSDLSGSGLFSTLKVAACPTSATSYPTAVTVTIKVGTTGEPTRPLVTLTSQILVSTP